MSRKSKNKKKIRKLKDDEEFGVNFDLTDSKEIFDDFLDSKKFNEDEKFDSEPIEKTEVKDNLNPNKQSFHNLLETEIDLHGMTSNEAIAYVDKFIESKGLECNILKIRVITGRGLHSGALGPVLAKEVHAYILATYKKRILQIESSPAETMMGGVTLRGHFSVKLKC
jgi:DNA-nicking Smr family endonuclease